MSPIKTSALAAPFASSFFNDLLDPYHFFGMDWMRNGYGPATNISETEQAYVLEMAAPGMKKGDFKIAVKDNLLQISAEQQEEKQEAGAHYTRREFSYHAFTRAFALPPAAAADKIEASYTDGVLQLTIPKTVHTQSKTKAVAVK